MTERIIPKEDLTDNLSAEKGLVEEDFISLGEKPPAYVPVEVPIDTNPLLRGITERVNASPIVARLKEHAENSPLHEVVVWTRDHGTAAYIGIGVAAAAVVVGAIVVHEKIKSAKKDS